LLEGKRLGYGVTTARQRASRLAGLVWFPCLLNRKGRHSATGLMARNKDQRGYKIPLAFCVTGISRPRRSIPSNALIEYRSEKTSLFFCAAKPAKLHCNSSTRID
ncbi:MAG: hypothetical protein PUJ39_07320, partial [Eubacteriales bacterium]|nr:hypothetical protein [Eubacteriales bacterium]